MVDNELLLALSDIMDRKLEPLKTDMQNMKSDMQNMKSDMQDMKSDIQDMKSDIQNMKSDIQNMKSDIQDMKSDIQDMKSDILDLQKRMSNVEKHVASLELTLENETNHNIRLLAENHSNLIDKLNQAIRVSDKTTIYEIQVNILTNKVEKLEKEIADLKNRIA